MPSLKMKTKPVTDSSKQKNSLHVCRMSSMISKNTHSLARVRQNAEVCILHNQEAFVYDKVHGPDLGGDGVLLNESRTKENISQNPSTQIDSATMDTAGPTLFTFTPNAQTIFSPILESMDMYDNQGNVDIHVPQLDTEDSDDGSRNSSDHQGCDVSDFHISDMIFSAPSAGDFSEFDNKTETMFLSDYKCEESSLICDLTEDYFVLPFLEDSLDTGCELGDRPSQQNVLDANNCGLFSAIHQLPSQSCDLDSQRNTFTDQDYECFDPQQYIRNLPDQLDMEFTLPPAPAAIEKKNTRSVTLVLDLDETLVHSTLTPCDDADFKFPVFFNMKEHIVYVRKRPHLQAFLNRVAEMFVVMVFTASQSIYAGPLLDNLDPDGKVISRRVYRDSCIFSEGAYVKDLTVLGVDLAKVVIIDNSPQVFRLQVNNGIPIKSWFKDPSDSALISLLPFLETLADAEDVRPIIARKFGNKE